jgi:hypothetical protein
MVRLPEPSLLTNIEASPSLSGQKMPPVVHAQDAQDRKEDDGHSFGRKNNVSLGTGIGINDTPWIRILRAKGKQRGEEPAGPAIEMSHSLQFFESSSSPGMRILKRA